MTRKDFELIADALRAARMTVHAPQHDRDCKAVADALGRDNPRFDRARFLQACGVAS